jgi:aryl-alcohol dehydrogenase-like predicted oxidoreductase
MTMTDSIGVGAAVSGVAKPMSRIALGTAFYRLAQKEQWFALLDHFRELGGTTIDSAHGYGESEKVVGQWLASRKASAQMLLITKCAHGNAILPEEGFEQNVDQEVAQSHQDLGVELIDLLFLHRDNPAVPVERIMAKLSAMVRSGHARAIGASNWSYDRIDAANAWAAKNGGDRRGRRGLAQEKGRPAHPLVVAGQGVLHRKVAAGDAGQPRSGTGRVQRADDRGLRHG